MESISLIRSSRRSVAIGLAVLVAVIGTAFAGAPPASACSLSSHCYGIALGSASGFNGVFAEIQPTCLSVPSGNFVTDEIWMTGANNAWIEAGFLQHGGGIDVGGITSAGRYGFWGQERPGGSFSNHVLVNNPPLQQTGAEIAPAGSGTWDVSMGTGSVQTTNSLTVTGGNWGSETTSGSAHSFGIWSTNEYHAGGSWHSGIPNATKSVNAPESFIWINKPVEFDAGVGC